MDIENLRELHDEAKPMLFGDKGISYTISPSEFKLYLALKEDLPEILNSLETMKKLVASWESNHASIQPQLKEPEPEVATIYLVAQRKLWHYILPDGWTETHWERFSYTECGIYTKPVADLTDEDRDDWIAYHSDIPSDWTHPSEV